MIWLEIDRKTIEEDNLPEAHKLKEGKVYVRPADATGWAIESVLDTPAFNLRRVDNNSIFWQLLNPQEGSF
jgi:hypothetical protein